MLMVMWMCFHPSPCLSTRLTNSPPPLFSSHPTLIIAMHLQNAEQASKKLHAALQVDFVHVASWYRVGKLLGSGGSGKPNSDPNSTLYHASLGSVYLGRDIRMGAEVALKIESIGQSPSGLSHEYNMYLSIAGSTGTSSVLWYGKEGRYKVIILEHLGISWQLTWKFDQWESAWQWEGILICIANGMFVMSIKKTLLNTLSCTAQSCCITTWLTLHSSCHQTL